MPHPIIGGSYPTRAGLDEIEPLVPTVRSPAPRSVSGRLRR
jgi:hypothetical protein